MSARCILAALAGVVVSSSMALSATLYSNFNTIEPDYLGSFDTLTGAPYIAGPDSLLGQANHVANGFVLPAGPGITGYQLDSVRLGMSLMDGQNAVSISIVPDDDGLPDDDHVLRSVTLIGQLPAYWEPGIVEASFGSNPFTLTPGQKYWLIAAPGQSDTAAGWHYNYAPDLVWNEQWESFDIVDNWLTGDTAWFNGDEWQASVHTDPMGTVPPNDALNAFSLEGSVMGVPEPGVIGIVAGPTLCALWLRRRTRTA